VAVQRQDEHWRGGRGGRLLAEAALDRRDRVLERGVVELDHVLVPGRSTDGEPSSQVDMHDAEPPEPSPRSTDSALTISLVTFGHLTDQRAVRPRRSSPSTSTVRGSAATTTPAKLQHRAAAS
jgi:hypothetical protein